MHTKGLISISVVIKGFHCNRQPVLEKETKVKLKKSLYDRPDKSSVYPVLDALVK